MVSVLRSPRENLKGAKFVNQILGVYIPFPQESLCIRRVQGFPVNTNIYLVNSASVENSIVR
jgi:hypothetical protein